MDALDRHGWIRVVDGMAMLGIPADVDERTVDELREIALARVRAEDIRAFVLDFSGVHALDSRLMTRLIELGRAVRALGAPVGVSGIRAGLASALVALGLTELGFPAGVGLDDCRRKLVGGESCRRIG